MKSVREIPPPAQAQIAKKRIQELRPVVEACLAASVRWFGQSRGTASKSHPVARH